MSIRLASAAATVVYTVTTAILAQEYRVELKPTMLTNEADFGDPSGLVDEQREIIGPPAGKPQTTWELNSKYGKQFPFSAYLDLGAEKNLSSIWFYDTNGKGDVVISIGKPGQWKDVATYDCGTYLAWAEVKLDITTRYLRITRKTPGANFSEVAVYEYSPEAYQAMLEREAEEVRREAERPVDMSVLYPTLLELCGLPADRQCDGRSIVPLLHDPEAAWDRPALMTYGYGNHAVRSERWRYIRYEDGSEELYDHDRDPNEWTNLASNPDSRKVMDDLAQWLPRTNAKPCADLKKPGKTNR